MDTRYTYIILLFSMIFVFSACKRGRRNRIHYNLIEKKEDATTVQIIGDEKNSSNSEIWNQEEFCLLTPSIPSNIPSQILVRLGYITSYNCDTKCPNWVAWHLAADRIDGPYPRKGVPYYDEDGTALGIGAVTLENQRGDYFLDLEAKEPRQLLSDWPNNEYNMTHGHICPAGDNRWSKAAMNQSFLLTNICPQTERLNNGSWKTLEEKCRTWATLFGSIYIISGPIYSDGKMTRTIGKSKVAVPDAFFKVILCLEGKPKAIGFLYKNDSSNQSMKNNVCSVDNAERLTGMDFFSTLPDEIENVIESNSNLTLWK